MVSSAIFRDSWRRLGRPVRQQHELWMRTCLPTIQAVAAWSFLGEETSKALAPICKPVIVDWTGAVGYGFDVGAIFVVCSIVSSAEVKGE